MTEFYAAGKRFPLNRTYVMGILNVTPDSFFAGSRTPEVRAASILTPKKRCATR